jgi:hypothetical protein
MVKTTEREMEIHDWVVDRVEVGERPNVMFAPVLKGVVKGENHRTDIILWLDTKEKVAMTHETAYKLGDPDALWYTRLVSSGYSLEDMDIKDTIH